MKRLCTATLLVILVMFIISGILSSSVAAHDLKTDNGISAVLHIAPDDNPKSGRDTALYFAFSSQNTGFNLDYCKCRVSFQASRNRLQSVAVIRGGQQPDSGYATVQFDRPGAYVLTLSGSASDDPSNRFDLKYTVRVVAGTSAAEARARRAAGLQVIMLIVTGLIIVAIIACDMIRRGGRYVIKAGNKR